MVELRADLIARVQKEILRLEEDVPDLAEVVRRAEAPSVHLWQRRPHHDDYLRVRVGTGRPPGGSPSTCGAARRCRRSRS